MRRVVAAAVVLALLAGAGATGAWVLDRDPGRQPEPTPSPAVEGGPLANPPGTRSAGYFPVDLGRPYAWGDILLRNDGTTSIRIDRVELIEPSPGLVFLGMHAVQPKGGMVGLAAGYAGAGFPAEGLVVPPGRDEEFELIIGLRIDAPGAYRIRGVRVHYHDALQRYVATFDYLVNLCGPAERYPTKQKCRRGL